MELEFLKWLRPRLPGHPQLHVGPGDDAAVVCLANGAHLSQPATSSATESISNSAVSARAA